MKVADVLRLLAGLEPDWPVRSFAVGFHARTSPGTSGWTTDVVLFVPPHGVRGSSDFDNGAREAGPDEPTPPPCAPPQGSPSGADAGTTTSDFACEVCGIDPVPEFSPEHSNEVAEALGMILCERCARRLASIA